MRQIRQPLAVVGGTIASLILFRTIITLWAWFGILPEDQRFFFGYVVIEVVADAAILAVASSVIIRFARQAAKTEREQRRLSISPTRPCCPVACRTKSAIT